jgi:hypothetical protein
MVRTGYLIAAALLGCFAPQPCPALPLTWAAFDDIAARDFDEIFNRELSRRDFPGRLHKDTCKAEHCSYLYKSVGVLVTPTSPNGKLDGLTWFCGKGCEPADLIVGISLSLRLLVPNLPERDYNTWIKDITPALQAGKQSETVIGPAKLKVGVYGSLGLMAFISSN